MDPKALAQSILEMLLNGLHQLHATKREGGHDDCYSLAEVEAFCRERAANIAQAMPALMEEPKQSLDQAQAQHYTNRLINRFGGRNEDIKESTIDIDKALDRLSRQIQAARAAAAIAAEGSPAVKDAFGLYMQATDELMKEAEKIQRAAAERINSIVETVRS